MPALKAGGMPFWSEGQFPGVRGAAARDGLLPANLTFAALSKATSTCFAYQRVMIRAYMSA